MGCMVTMTDGPNGAEEKKDEVGPPLIALLPMKLMESDMFHLEQLSATVDKAKEPNCMTVQLRPFQLLWVPYGTIPIAIGCAEVNGIHVYPYPCRKMIDGVDANEWDVVTTASMAFARKNSAKEPWRKKQKTKQMFGPMTKLLKQTT